MMTALKWRMKACSGFVALCVMFGGLAARAQSASAKPSGDTAKADVVAKAEIRDPRRAKLIADTQKMLALSREVQAEMAKSGPDTLSLATVKKVEELQKLAATVKAEMSKLP